MSERVDRLRLQTPLDSEQFSRYMLSILNVKWAYHDQRDGEHSTVAKGVVNRLREVRQEHGLTQEHLAADLDVTRHTILALEVGRYVPSIELALRLAAYFNRPLETIFWLVPEDDRRLRGQAPKTAVAPGQEHLKGEAHDGDKAHN
jgi:putative transcriptional regulator